ncbi:MAG: HNH endonuclease signature motif containing protein [Actinomycetota bacterium]
MTPRAIASKCAEPGCPDLAHYRGRCPKHATVEEQERGSAAARGYNAQWRRVRIMYLRRHPLCERCEPPAEHVHHRDQQAKGPQRFDFANLEALCETCHMQHHGGVGGHQSLGPTSPRPRAGFRQPRSGFGGRGGTCG